MSTTEYAIIVPSTDISVLYPGVMSITEYATIVPSTDTELFFLFCLHLFFSISQKTLWLKFQHKVHRYMELFAV